ncbi:MAG: hypothetical protein A2940_00995 [Candidatus Wildermuthbacteria bacterium RIFCSPLOWO2_01_FULL_48_29]|uniref:VWFA domain-containing protein n=2 Tax=Candidatus Wildermuthiibacteriota TaxID=1817923 RepID=A0A1G2RKF2_9BACT|nr:MAG: hypothetical protein A2843_01100 [Candidatus Wildermuthbacteria bacterium RIFCSPHIGHO2_01_FULL_48_27b]OHA73287.1 MAG: hypothetical protein A2940_00995 [Candidatus Wildermuthbacteria bacterium RIFCSPLOWO2_01_FULL_48_29]
MTSGKQLVRNTTVLGSVLMAMVLAFVVLMPQVAQGANGDPPSISPSSVVVDIPQGGETVIEKTVQTSTIPPKVDIYFLSDTTGSMGRAIAAVQGGAGAVLATIDAATPDARYGAGDYKDFQSPTQLDPYAFNNAAPIPGVDDNGAAALAAIGGWAAAGGFDGPEGQLYALHQLAAHGAAAFRPSATKVVVWFGDINGHDPVCAAISGDPHAVTLASLLPELTTAGIIVNAISTVGGPGLDGVFAGGDYAAACGPEPAPAGGQGLAITGATGGTSFVGVAPAAISAAILAGLSSLPVTVSMASDCAAPISTTFAPVSVGPVPSGSAVSFLETISVAPGAVPGVYECDDWALINGTPMVDASGETIKEHKKITVTDVTPPAASCTPTTNPAGENVPTAPGKGAQGQNQDGFYVLNASDAVDSSPDIYLVDDGTGTVFGPFVSGTKIKYAEANGAVPSQKPGSGVINWKINGQGDAQVYAVDASGNKSAVVSCLVPPEPK